MLPPANVIENAQVSQFTSAAQSKWDVLAHGSNGRTWIEVAKEDLPPPPPKKSKQTSHGRWLI
jgi:hypothetical protein